MSDDRPPPDSGADRPDPGADRPDPAEVTLPAMASVAAAIHEFGPEVLHRAADPDADHEAEIGRHILQAVDAELGHPGSLRDIVDRLAGDPQDDAALADLTHAVESATAADPELLAKVDHASHSDDPVTEDSGIPPRSAPTE